MPKKTRRMKERAAMRRAATLNTPVVDGATETGGGAADREPVRMRPAYAAPPRSSLADYDYTHIYGDLKRIALFASFFFIVLIALSFVIK